MPFPLDNPDDKSRVVRFRHRAHVVYSAQHDGGWSYFIDVASSVRTFWVELLDDIETPAPLAVDRRQADGTEQSGLLVESRRSLSISAKKMQRSRPLVPPWS